MIKLFTETLNKLTTLLKFNIIDNLKEIWRKAIFDFFYVLFIFGFFFISMLLMAVGSALYISEILNSSALGFFSVGAFFLFLFLFLLFIYKLFINKD